LVDNSKDAKSLNGSYDQFSLSKGRSMTVTSGSTNLTEPSGLLTDAELEELEGKEINEQVGLPSALRSYHIRC